MAEKKYKELIPRTLEQRYQFAIISELCELNKGIAKLLKEIKAMNKPEPKEPATKPKAQPKKRATTKTKAKPKPKEVKDNDSK